MVKAPQPPGAPSPHASHTHCDGHGHHNLSGARIARQEAPACAFLHTTLRGSHTRTESAARFVSASPCCGTARAASPKRIGAVGLYISRVTCFCCPHLLLLSRIFRKPISPSMLSFSRPTSSI